MPPLGPAGRRRRRALKNWSPVAPGPMPEAIRKLFAEEASRMAEQWIQPRQAAVTGYTNQLASDLGGIEGQIGNAYGQAQQGQAASDAALAQMLRGQGQGLSEDLAKALAAAGQSTAPAAGIAQQGQGAAGASFAMGSAGMGNLLSQGAAQRAYAAKLPGLARLGGAQTSGRLQAQGAEMERESFEKITTRELEKYMALHGFQQNQAELSQQNEQFYAGLAADTAGAGADAAADKLAEHKERIGKREDAVQEWRKEGTTLARDLRKGLEREITITSGPDTGDTKTIREPVPYAEAFRQVMALIAPNLRRYAVSKKRLQGIVREALVAAGYPSQSQGGGNLAGGAASGGGHYAQRPRLF